MVQYGYRVTTESLPVLAPTLRRGASIQMRNLGDDCYRPVSASLPLIVLGACLPKPDLSHGPTISMGAAKRIANPLPESYSLRAIGDSRCLKVGIAGKMSFYEFVLNELPKRLVPLDADADVSVATWLSEAPYTLSRKEELASLDIEEVNRPFKHIKCKSFIKDEHYYEFKHARTINPRDDYFKVFSGPIFHAIEKVVFEQPVFIKKVPLPDRPAYIMEKLYAAGGVYQITDYTSFESSFTRPLMKACEILLYRYMTKNIPGGKVWCDVIEKVLCGPQTLVFKNAKVKTIAGRCSGDMCTSLGNGFSNWMLMLYCSYVQDLGSLHGVFEGDDGLCRFSSGRVVDSSLLSSLGFTVKMEVVDSLTKASFCGLLFDEYDQQQVGDPMEFLARLGWTTAKYLGSRRSVLLALLRSKALSGLYQFPCCPIISVVCRRVIELTRGVCIRRLIKCKGLSTWDRERLKQAALFKDLCLPIGVGTRELVSVRFGISPTRQVQIEEELSKIQLGSIELDCDFDPLWKRVWERYVVPRCPVPNDPWHYARQLEGPFEPPSFVRR